MGIQTPQTSVTGSHTAPPRLFDGKKHAERFRGSTLGAWPERVGSDPRRAASGASKPGAGAAGGDGPGHAPLGKLRTTFPEGTGIGDRPVRSQAASAAREARFLGRSTARSITCHERVKWCGTPMRHGVAFRLSESGRASVAGMRTCGSVWLCPVCSHTVGVQRAMDLAKGIRRWLDSGGQIVFATFTVRHSRSDSLESVWGALQVAQKRAIGGRRWQADQAEFGIAGWHRTTEVTVSDRSGWHPHYHTLFFVKKVGGVQESDVARLRARLFERWGAGLASVGFDASWRHGVDVRLAETEVGAADAPLSGLPAGSALAQYVAKAGTAAEAQLAAGRRIAMEAVLGAHKRARDEHGLTPFALLGLIAEARTQLRSASGPRQATLRRLLGWALGCWREYELFAHGKRQVTASRSDTRSGRIGLRDLLQLDVAVVDAADEVLAAAESEPGGAEVVAVVGQADAERLAARLPWAFASLLTVLELDGVDALVAAGHLLGIAIRTGLGDLGTWEFEEGRLRYGGAT